MRKSFWRRIPGTDAEHREQIDEAAEELRAANEVLTPTPPPRRQQVRMAPPGAMTVPTAGDLAEFEQFLHGVKMGNMRESALIDHRQTTRSGANSVSPENEPEELRLRRRRLAALEARKQEARDEIEAEDAAKREANRQARLTDARKRLLGKGLTQEEANKLAPKLVEMEAIEAAQEPEETPFEYRPMIDKVKK